MLEFLLVIGAQIILLVAIIVFRVIVLMLRFIDQKTAVVEICRIFERMIEKGAIENGKEFTIKFDKYQIEFSNIKEGCTQIEMMAKSTIEITEKFGKIFDDEETLRNEKNELINVCTTVRRIKWQQK